MCLIKRRTKKFIHYELKYVDSFNCIIQYE